MKKPAKIEFAAIPEWAMPAAPGALSFFETIALADLEGKWIRLSADTQRAILGANVFGKQEIRVSEDGICSVRRTACFGMVYEGDEYELRRIRAALDSGKRLSPGVYGGRYLG